MVPPLRGGDILVAARVSGYFELESYPFITYQFESGQRLMTLQIDESVHSTELTR